jgi:hypothetical protein
MTALNSPKVRRFIGKRIIFKIGLRMTSKIARIKAVLT